MYILLQITRPASNTIMSVWNVESVPIRDANASTKGLHSVNSNGCNVRNETLSIHYATAVYWRFIWPQHRRIRIRFAAEIIRDPVKYSATKRTSFPCDEAFGRNLHTLRIKYTYLSELKWDLIVMMSVSYAYFHASNI